MRMCLVKLLPAILAVTVIFLWTASTSPVNADTLKAKEHFNSGIKAKEAGKIDSAIIFYKAAIEEDPDFVDSYVNLGAIYFEKGNYEQARQMFKIVTGKDKTNAAAFANLGRVEYTLRKYVEAEAAFQAAIALENKNAEYYKELTKVYYKKQDYPKAIETVLKCHKLGGADANTYYILGKGYEKQKKTQDAINAFNKSIELKNNYKARSALGQIYLRQQKYAKAAQQFKAALKVEPKAWRAAYNYAVAIQSLNPEDYDTNLKAWENFVKRAKNIPKAKNQVAEAQRVIKELKEAKKKAELQ
ncbi:MAG: tetratricopeptide repeat protein [Candidatus Zixiibacteriota bacterium]